MPTLRKFTLSKDKDKGDWVLMQTGATRARRRFATKGTATARGALEAALGAAGGSVSIRKEDGKIQEERTFPRSADPKGSRG